MLAHHLRRWVNTVPTLCERLVFAGMPQWDQPPCLRAGVSLLIKEM